MSTYTKGQRVIAKTTSGEPVICTVIEQDELTGEWLLNSPEHGHAIQRAAWELEKESDLCALPTVSAASASCNLRGRAEAMLALLVEASPSSENELWIVKRDALIEKINGSQK